MVKPIFVIPVHGTWLPDKDWWLLGSDFYINAAQNNVYYYIEEGFDYEPFNWSGDLDGISLFDVLTFGLRRDKHTDWIAGGKAFRLAIRHVPLQHRNLIIHSHGLQVVAYSKVKLNNIITVGSPIRGDMEKHYETLKKDCNNWMHIYDDKWDRMGFLGQLFDGKWFGSRECCIPGVINYPVKGIGHSSILRDEEKMKLWVTNGWFNFLRQ